MDAAPHGRIVSSGFRPAAGLRNPHAQTLYPLLFRRHADVRTRAERLSLPDGDFLDLAWAADAPANGPLVLILHGLEGSIRSHYAAGLMNALTRAGYRSVLMHFRGCSGEPNRLPRSYHSGETGDLHWVIHLLRQRHPRTPLAAVGFSLGGNVLLKWLGEQSAKAPLVAAVAVSVPFSLAIAAERLEQGFSRLYQGYLLHRLRRSLAVKRTRIEMHLPVQRTHSLRTFRAFDDAVTAPLHGFRDVDDYYARASSRPYLRRIARPTLLIQAHDDPFLTPAILPAATELSSWVCLELSQTGGHVGFIEGALWRPAYWLERRIPNFLRAQMTS